jgi:hypothetical protein
MEEIPMHEEEEEEEEEYLAAQEIPQLFGTRRLIIVATTRPVTGPYPEQDESIVTCYVFKTYSTIIFPHTPKFTK